MKLRDLALLICRLDTEVRNNKATLSLKHYTSLCLQLTKAELEEMPIYVKNRNLLTETDVKCSDGGIINLSSDTRYKLDLF